MALAAVRPVGVRDGDPEALAGLCERRGPGVLAYCELVAADGAAPAAAADAFARFRAVVAHSEDLGALNPDALLLGATRHAAAERAPRAAELSAALPRPAQPATSSCPDVPVLLARRAEGAISPAEQDDLDRHLGECAACRAAGTRFAAAERIYRDPPGTPLPPDVASAIVAALAAAAPIRAAEREPDAARAEAERRLADDLGIPLAPGNGLPHDGGSAVEAASEPEAAPPPEAGGAPAPEEPVVGESPPEPPDAPVPGPEETPRIVIAPPRRARQEPPPAPDQAAAVAPPAAPEPPPPPAPEAPPVPAAPDISDESPHIVLGAPRWAEVFTPGSAVFESPAPEPPAPEPASSAPFPPEPPAPPPAPPEPEPVPLEDAATAPEPPPPEAGVDVPSRVGREATGESQPGALDQPTEAHDFSGLEDVDAGAPNAGRRTLVLRSVLRTGRGRRDRGSRSAGGTALPRPQREPLLIPGAHAQRRARPGLVLPIALVIVAVTSALALAGVFGGGGPASSTDTSPSSDAAAPPREADTDDAPDAGRRRAVERAKARERARRRRAAAASARRRREAAAERGVDAPFGGADAEPQTAGAAPTSSPATAEPAEPIPAPAQRQPATPAARSGTGGTRVEEDAGGTSRRDLPPSQDTSTIPDIAPPPG